MSFYERTWKLIKKIPKGRVTTYKHLARAMNTKAYRAVGNACHNNSSSKVPCHRVICSDSTVGGFRGGVRKKINMLRKEGIEIRDGKIVNFEKVLFKFR